MSKIRIKEVIAMSLNNTTNNNFLQRNTSTYIKEVKIPKHISRMPV